MPKLTDLRNRFEAAVTANAYIQTFHAGLVEDVDRLLRSQYPIFVLEPPRESSITGYKSQPFEVTSVTFWVFTQKKNADTEQDVWRKIDEVKDYGYDVIDYVISKATRPAYYDLSGDVRMRIVTGGLNPGTVAVEFTLDISINDCRNES